MVLISMLSSSQNKPGNKPRISQMHETTWFTLSIAMLNDLNLILLAFVIKSS